MKRLSVLTSFLALFLVFGTARAAGVSPTNISGATTIDTATAKQLFDQGVLFNDTRKNSDWDAGRNVEQAAVGTQEVNSNISGVSQSVDQSSRSAGFVLEAANDLTTQSDTLKSLVEDYLGKIKAV